MIELVHSWRRFPFIDPEIPDELLPASWFGHRAREVFDEKHAAWACGSQAYFDELEESAARV
jgi:phenylacetic acid degradation operon negative regulatory protein